MSTHKNLLYGFRISLPTWNVWQEDKAGHKRAKHIAVLYEQVAQELRDDLPLQRQVKDEPHNHLGKDDRQGLEADVAHKGNPQVGGGRVEVAGGLAEVHRGLEAGEQGVLHRRQVVRSQQPDQLVQRLQDLQLGFLCGAAVAELCQQVGEGGHQVARKKAFHCFWVGLFGFRGFGTSLCCSTLAQSCKTIEYVRFRYSFLFVVLHKSS